MSVGFREEGRRDEEEGPRDGGWKAVASSLW